MHRYASAEPGDYTRLHPVPTVEETIQEMSGGKVFSKLDLNMAYHQVELHPDSRKITTNQRLSWRVQYV